MSQIFSVFCQLLRCINGLLWFAGIFLHSLFLPRVGAAVRIAALESQLDECIRHRQGKRIERFSDSFRILWVIISLYWHGWQRFGHILNQVIIFNQTHLRQLIGRYVNWYNNHRLHQSLHGKRLYPSRKTNHHATEGNRIIPRAGRTTPSIRTSSSLKGKKTVYPSIQQTRTNAFHTEIMEDLAKMNGSRYKSFINPDAIQFFTITRTTLRSRSLPATRFAAFGLRQL